MTQHEPSDNQSTVLLNAIQLIGAVLLLLLALYVGWDVVRPNAPPPKTAPIGSDSVMPKPLKADATTVSPVVALESHENPDLLKASGYQFNKAANWWERSAEVDAAEFRETEFLIYDEQGNWVISGSVFVVLNECAWVPKSASKFQYRNGSLCSLENLLRHKKYQQRLALSQHLIFLGMESYEGAPNKADSGCPHQWLTECRANEMADRTYNAIPDGWPLDLSFWVLDLGAAQTKSKSLEFDQRRSVVLGVKNRRSELSIQQGIAIIAKRTPIGDVQLKDYAKIETATAHRIQWEPGESEYKHK